MTKSSSKQLNASEKAVSLSNEMSETEFKVRLFSQSDADYQQYLCDMMMFGISFWRVDEGVYIRIPPMDVYINGDTYTYREEGQTILQSHLPLPAVSRRLSQAGPRIFRTCRRSAPASNCHKFLVDASDETSDINY